MKNICIVGCGYVGYSLSLVLAKNNNVTAFDIDKNKVNLINSRLPLFDEDLIIDYLKSNELHLVSTNDLNYIKENVYDYFVIALPTDFDDSLKKFNTQLIEEYIEKIVKFNTNAKIIIKSTVWIGFTDYINKKLKTDCVMFSPEFLREGSSLYDSLYPSRIIVGGTNKESKEFGELLLNSSEDKKCPVIYTSSKESESIKLFSNAYLAMRVAFFNEIDSFSLMQNLDSRNIIQSVCLDNRIGNFYNNPSFGYGGYCLPKDTKQLLECFDNTPQNIIKSIIDSNITRIKFIADQIINSNKKRIGIFRLVMKMNSDNYRQSSIAQIIKILKNYNNIEIFIYEPLIKDSEFDSCKVLNDLDAFKSKSEIIVTNRRCDSLSDVDDIIFTRDLFNYS